MDALDLDQSRDVNAVDESFHEHVTLKESSFICDSCGKKYQTKSGLQKHLNNKHGASGGNMKLECQTCKLKFTTRGHLEGHVNSHHDLKPHDCTLCNKRYNYRSTLLRHVSTDHTTQKEKPPKPVHTCLICRRTFNRKDLLADCMRGKHSNEFRYKCDTCGSSFRWRGSLNRHRHSRHGKSSYMQKDMK